MFNQNAEERVCPMCDGCGKIWGGIQPKGATNFRVRDCPSCNGDGKDHQTTVGWKDWIIGKILDAEVLIRKREMGLAAVLIRLAGAVACIDQNQPMGRFELTLMSQMMETERARRLEADPRLRDLLGKSHYGMAMVTAAQMRSSDSWADELINATLNPVQRAAAEEKADKSESGEGR